MSLNEQQEVKERYFNEAIRYMDNAKDCLKKANKEDNFYRDKKYVRMACGTAYSGLLIALEGFLILRGIDLPPKKVRKSIEFYQSSITNIDKKMLDYLNSSYKILHLYGYYDGLDNYNVIKEGFDNAYTLIDKIKPN